MNAADICRANVSKNLATKESRRAAMPTVTKWLDEIRKEFGEPAGASENGLLVRWGTLR